jgi:arginine utilization regulatory protein
MGYNAARTIVETGNHALVDNVLGSGVSSVATTLNRITMTADALMGSLQGALDGILMFNSTGNIVFFNEACVRLTGYSVSEAMAVENPCCKLFQCQDEQGRPLGESLCSGNHLFEGRIGTGRQRVVMKRKDSRAVWVEVVFAPLKDGQGRTQLVMGILRDISETKQREDEIQQSADTIRRQLQQYQVELSARYGSGQIVASSEAMHVAFDRAHAASQSEIPVLIDGEAGTGKTTLAKMIHYHSARQRQPFITGTCSAIEPDALETILFGTSSHSRVSRAGWIQAAAGGTLFLQHVEALPVALQLQLAQVLRSRQGPVIPHEQGHVDFRLIASARQVTDVALKDGALRPELFHATDAIHISMPPLRHRTEDIPLLVQHFLDRCNRMGSRQATHIAPRTWSLLMAYDWPGNIRELQHAIESAYALGTGETLQAEDLPGPVRGQELALPGVDDAGLATSLDEILEHAERRAILAALRRARGRRNLAAKLMGISRSRLYRRMEALNIVPSINGQLHG